MDFIYVVVKCERPHKNHVFSYTGAGVVRQRAVVGQGDIFLLPLFVQRAATPLPQDALSDTTGVMSSRHRTAQI